MDFAEAKQHKERGLSVNEALEEMNKDKDKYEDVIIIGLNKDRQIEFSYSTDNTASAIGYLEVVKQHFIDDITG